MRFESARLLHAVRNTICLRMRGYRHLKRAAGIPTLLILLAMQLPASAITYVYDGNGRLQSATNSANETAHYVYDSRGNLVRVERTTVAQMAITSFSPNHGVPGSQVTLSGTGFGATTSANSVFFNGTSAPVLTASATQLLVQVPLNASTGKVSVTVGGATAVSAEDFSIAQIGVPPVITSVAPAVIGYGGTVTITGLSMYPIPGSTAVSIGGVNVIPSSVDDQQIVLAVPAYVGSGSITVTTPFGATTSTTTLFVVPTGFVPSSVTSTATLVPGSTSAPISIAASSYSEIAFKVDSGDYLSLQASSISTSNNVSYSVVSPFGVVVASGNISVTAPTVHLPRISAAGTYSVLFGAGSAAVQLSMSVEKNADLTSIGTVPVATTVQSQSKRLKFIGVQGSSPGISIQNLTIVPSSVASANINVYRPNGSLMVSTVCPLSSNGCGLNLGTLPAGGIYTVSIVPAGAATMNFSGALAPEVTGSILADGVATSFTISTPGQAANLKFSGSPGQRISLKTTANSLTGPTSTSFAYKIVNPDGTVLASYQYNSGATLFFGPFTLPQAGIYTLTVIPTAGGTGSMTWQLFNVPADTSGTIPMDGTSTLLTIGTPGQAANLTFSGAAGQRISLKTITNSLTGYASTSYAYRITNPDGTLLSSYQYNSGATSFFGPFTLPQAGIYTLSVIPTAGGTGSITWQLFNVPPDTSGPIPMDGTSTPVTMGTPGQAANLTFSGTAGQRISFKTTTNSLTGYASTSYAHKITNPDGTVLSSYQYNSGATSFFGPFTLLQTGTYTLTVTPTAGGTGSVTWQLFNVPADTSGTIPMDGSSTSLTIGTPGQAANLTFNGAAGQRISLKSTANTLTGYASTLYAFKIVNPDGTVLTSYSNASGTASFFGPFTLLQTGTYTLTVTPSTGGTGSMTWQLFNVPADTSGTIPVDGTATSLTIGTPGQAANLTFSGTAGQRISLKTIANGLTGSAGTIYAYKIVNPNGTVLTSNSNGSGTASFFGPFTLLQTGTYTLTVTPSTGGTGSMTWQLFNVSADTSGTIPMDGTATSLTIGTPGQAANLTFSGIAGQRISLKTIANGLTGPAGTIYAYKVVNPNGTVLTSGSNASGTASFFGPFTLTQTGAHTLTVTPTSGGTGSMTWQLFNVQADTTGPIAINGASVPTNLASPGQAATLTFSGVSGHTITLQLSGSTFPGYYYVAILNPNGSSVLAKTMTSGSYTFGPYTLSQTGGFKIVISQYSGATGSVTVALTGS